HGLRTDRVVIGGEPDELSKEALAEVQSVCAHRGVDLAFIPLFLRRLVAEVNGHSTHENPNRLPSGDLHPNVLLSPSFCFKRLIDVVAALLLILLLLPLLAISAVLVLLDVGSPVVFWQQRVGQSGRELQLYKLRTLRSPCDRRGRRVSEERRA